MIGRKASTVPTEGNEEQNLQTILMPLFFSKL